MSRSVLITGGAGFIGSNFVRLLLAERDWEIVVLDKLTYSGHRLSLEEPLRDPRLVFVEGDIADRRTVRRVFSAHSPAAVVNLAAESHVDRSLDDPSPFVTTNVVGTFELLEASRLHLASGGDPHTFRFLHVSTDEVFGALGDRGRFRETTPYAPRSPYAASKAAADHLVRAYHHSYGLPTLLTNCSNNFGPYQYPEKLIPLMILNALEGRDLPIYGSGGNVRDWLYVEDHCRGLLTVLEAGTPGASYNLGGDDSERTNLEIVERLCAILDRQRPDNPALARRGLGSYRELETFVPDRPGHDWRYAMDSSKIRRELGWAPAVSLDEGLERTVSWYLSHLDWCEAVQTGVYDRRRLGLSPSLSDPPS